MDEREDSSHEMVLFEAEAGTPAGVPAGVPAIVYAAGHAARFAWDEFFGADIRNVHTRRAYLHAVRRFLGWCQAQAVELARVSPGLVGRYFDEHPGSVPTKKLHLAALRRFFDLLVLRHAVILNPALSVRGERYQVVEGKTPEIAVEQARALLRSIDVSQVVGLRDRALIAVLIYTAARVGAVCRLRVHDLQHDGSQWCLRFTEKGGKSREIPVRHDLERFLLDYLASAGGQAGPGDRPLFRSAAGRTRRLTDNTFSAADACHMVKRRLRDARLPTRLSPHSFRVTTITDLLEQGVPLEDVQYLAGHEDPRTTRLYDRRKKRVTRNIVERISV
jgi:site-specific recombinase XerD